MQESKVAIAGLLLYVFEKQEGFDLCFWLLEFKRNIALLPSL
jgi:hypothetical protein